MELVLSEEQELLASTAADFVQQRSPVARFRALRDSGDAIGFSPQLWREMGELGWLGIPFSEADGGAGLGLAALCPVLEALGRNLAPEPLVPALLLAGRALSLGASEALRAQWLPRLVAGEIWLALAQEETRGGFDPFFCATRAVREGGDWRIDGAKQAVLGAPGAAAFVVVARSAGDVGAREGLTLFCVESGRAGLELQRQQRVDSQPAALLRFGGLRVSDAARIGAEGQGAELLEAIFDAARVGLAAEMLGGASACFERTLAYLKQRVQFGVPIGSFQALKHRAAGLFIEIELARSCVMAAARALDAASAEAPALVALAKARCSDAYSQVASEGIQLHGGIGMTDEHDIGFYFKRARAAAFAFGDGAWQRARWARLAGY